MAEALCVTDSEPNLEEVFEELSIVEDKTPEEKTVDTLKSDNNGVYELILQKNFGPNLTTVLENMKLYFGHSDFISIAQKNTIISILRRKRDVIICMPTGHGRSLCYQLPAILQSPKVTIVVCPIIKRIKDHVKDLIRLNVHAEYLTAETSEDEQKRIVNELCSQNVVNYILYVTPDRAFTDDFHKLMSSLVQKSKLAYMVLDEAHCESQWVYGPKNEYRILGYLRKIYYEIPWIVVTAEAGLDIIDYIKTTLLLKSVASGSLVKFQTPAFKSNIFYDVIFDEINGNLYSHLKIFIDSTLPKVENYKKGHQPCGLIFCKTRKKANDLAMALRLKGSLSTTYHAGLTENEQLSTYNSFMRGCIQVLAVTGDYGMKIDNKQVKLVVHWGLPSSLSKYYEESRQAGKDGNLARCRIYLTESSTKYFNRENQYALALSMSEAMTSSKMQNAVKSFLLFIQSRFMIDYCLYNACRHLLFAEYFGDTKPQCEKNCDVCLLSIIPDIKDLKRIPNNYAMEKFVDKTYMKFIKLDKMDKLVAATDPSHILKACNDMLMNYNFNTAEKLFKSYYQKDKPLSTLSIEEEDEEEIEEDLV